MLNEVEQAELCAFPMLRQQNQSRIEAQQILAVPVPMIVSLIGEIPFVPARKMFVEEKVQLEMDMRPVLGDALVCVGRAHVHFELNLFLNEHFASWYKRNFPDQRN